MRILYLHQFFITRAGVGGTRSYELARRFVERGHEVVMVTAGSGRRTVDGIEVIGVPGAYADYMRATAMPDRGRIGAFARFAAGATATAVRAASPDVLYATSPPLTMALPALAARARHRAPLVFEVRDLWPEAPIQMGALEQPALRAGARALERLAYRAAAELVALSPGIREGMIEAGAPPERVTLIPNGADLELFTPDLDATQARSELGLAGRFVCSYFGAMGEANDLTPAIEAAAMLREEGVTFVLLGEGKRRPRLERMAEELGADNVVFRDPVPDKRSVAKLAAASDACLTLFKQVPILATNSPNKLFDTFAAGRPAIVNMDGWMRELVDANEAGLYVRDAEDLAGAIRRLRDDPEGARRMGRNARALAEREFDRDVLADRALGVLERAAG
jgi:glycosyltransferase involved in cell wall biosynthesis